MSRRYPPIPRRRPPCVLAVLGLLLAASPGCSLVELARGRKVLREYQLTPPQRQIAAPVWLASFTTDELGGRLSRDGRRLLYAGSQKGDLDIWLKDLTTGVPERIAEHVAIDTQPCWSPDEKQIAFVSMRVDAKGDVFLYRGGELTALTDRTTADSFPVFSADGTGIYFASGPEGQSRIELQSLASRERKPVTGWGATHPAASPDGRYLAYTQFDENGRGRIAVMRLADGSVRIVTTPDYHAGFPAFSSDSRRLVFSRFTGALPFEPVSTESIASIWQLELGRALEAQSPEAAMAGAVPLTSGRSTALFPQLTAQGLVFTTQRAGSLDIGVLPASGPVPRLSSAGAQLALALAENDPRDQLLALFHVQAWGPGPAASQALYLSAIKLRELEEFDAAEAALRRLVDESALRHGDYSYLAQIDRVTVEVQRRLWQAARGGKEVTPGEMLGALAGLDRLSLPDQPSAQVRAHLLLRRGDLLRLAGENERAIQVYEQLLREHAGERERAVEAKFRLGQLFGRLDEPDLLSRYYLTLFSSYPNQRDWLRRAAEAVLELQRNRLAAAPKREAESLRAMIDANRDKPLFCALAQARIAQIYESAGRLDLAIESLHRVVERYSSLLQESTQAAFELGRLCLVHSDKLRQAGRLSDALAFYSQALGAYERIVRAYEPGHEHHVRARAEYLRLSLLEAAQLERDGETALAEKRYRKMLELDPGMLQAHRKLIARGVQEGRSEELAREYRKRISSDAGDAVGHYGLGYLATLGKPLDEAALARAEKHLQRAVELNPQSPFGHMTLGWVQEMRERFLGQTHRGWLEEAIVLYDRAHGLNDARVDVQTEADLLVNLCSAFINLGNGGRQAYESCQAREKLKLPFLTRVEEAAFRLTHGRAASATGQYDVARRQLERALDLSRDLSRPRLETEVVARLALNAHLQGDYEDSSRYLRQAAEHYRRDGQNARLTGLSRSLAYSAVLRGDRKGALDALDESRAQRGRHGALELEKWTPIGGMGRSTAPFGFDAFDEGNADLALEGLLYSKQKAWPEILGLLERRLANREAVLEQRDDDELRRELPLLRNRIALIKLRLGQRTAAHRTLDQAFELCEKLQTDPKEGFAPDADLFPVQVAIALSSAEEVLSGIAHGDAGRKELTVQLARLKRLNDVRTSVLKDKNVEILPDRLLLSLWNDLGLLSFHAGLRGWEDQPSPGPKGQTRPGAALQRLLSRGEPLLAAQRLLKRVLVQTSPSAPPGENLAEKLAAAAEKGSLAPLWRPLRPFERLRWHVLAGMNLAEVSAALTPSADLARHPSTALLKDLALLCTKHGLGALRFAVAAALHSRSRDLRAMQTAVDGFLARSPLLLEETSRSQAALLRQQILGRAQELALQEKDYAAALSFAEQEERRAFLDELAALSPSAQGGAAGPLRRLLEQAASYRRLLRQRSPHSTEEEREAWQAKLNVLEQRAQTELEALRQAAPRVAELFTVPAFPLQGVLGALEKPEVAITALRSADRIVLVALRPSVPLTSVSLESTASAEAAGRGAALSARLKPLLTRLAGDAVRVYIDLGRIDPDLKVEQLLPGKQLVRLATLWELVDARSVRTVALPGGVVAHPEASTAQALASALGLRPLGGKELSQRSLARPFEQASVLVWAGPLRFDGGEAPNLRLLLHSQGHQRFEDLRLAQSLGSPLRGQLLIVTQAQHTPGRKRAEQVALARLVHSMGISSLLLVDGGGTDAATLARTLRPVLRALPRTDLAAALAQSVTSSGNLQLFGDAGLGPSEAKAFAKKRLAETVRAGAAAFKARRLPEAVEHLELALRAMEALKDSTYLDGALLFLAQSYTLLEDFSHAVPHMERLLSVRAAAIALAKKEGKPAAVLGAQAKWVEALQSMAWLRLRNKEYGPALAANRAAIDLYLEVKRPLLARPAYAQRSIIAEEKGDMVEAQTYARRALEASVQALAPSPTSAPARAAVSEAAKRLARVLRQRFSDFTGAMEAARLAMAHAPTARAGELTAATTRLSTLEAELRQATARSAPAQELAALRTRLSETASLRSRLAGEIEDRLDSQLEIIRVLGARGDYDRAIEAAEAALALVRESGLPLQDRPLLEMVNNLYYVGRYDRALLLADEGLREAGKNERRQIQFYNLKGTVFGALGRTPEALQNLELALRIASRLNVPSEIASSQNNLGEALRRAGRFADAEARFQAALAIDRRAEDRAGVANDRANLGVTEALLGRSRRAREELEQALALSRELGAPLTELKAQAGLGRLDLSAGQARPALDRFRLGLRLSQRLGLRNWSWRFHLLSARSLRQERKLGEAQSELHRGLALIEDLPPRPRKALGAPKVEEDPEDLYYELIDLFAEMGQAAPALELCERLRARSVVDRLGPEAAQLPLKDASELLARITRLQQELEAARTGRARARTASEISSAEQETQRLEAELKTLRSALSAVNPQLPSLVSPEASPLSKLRPLLAAQRNEVVLVYHVGEKRLLIWTLRAGELQLKTVAVSRQTLQDTVGRFRDALLRYHPVEELGKRLHGWLIGPVLPAGGTERLVIVPSGPLHVLPFAALHDGTDYLVARRELTMLPSLGALRFLGSTTPAEATRSARRASTSPAGGSRPASRAGRARKETPRAVSFAWAGSDGEPLSFVPREADSLAQALGGAEIIRGREATRARFRSEAASADLLHVSTHGHFNEEAPFLSSLELADGELPLVEVLGLQLQARLAILSACETGLGQLDGADGVVGLHQAFLAAGARRVLSTLWRVSDLGTALLMKRFFRRLATGERVSSALRTAQNEIRRRFPHPAFWAGLRLDGALED